MLDAIARDYVKQPSHDQQLLTQEDSSSIPTTGEESAAEAQARAVLRESRHTLNQFRNSRWEALVNTRKLRKPRKLVQSPAPNHANHR